MYRRPCRHDTKGHNVNAPEITESESMPRASFSTVGCKLNTYETEMLRYEFARAGYEIVDFGDSADVTVINTCTVTSRADADCRKMIRRARRASINGTVVVTGCMAERATEDIAGMSEVDLVIGNAGKAHVLERVTSFRNGTSDDETVFAAPSLAKSQQFLTIHSSDEAGKHGRTRATLQVQDGCDEHCTYCIIPSVRGRSRSRPLSEIVEHARRIAGMGYREIAITGVNTGAYGEDTEASARFLDVLRAIAEIDGIERVRVNSIEPNAIDDALIDFLTTEPKICRHYHIPLQSGSDGVLKRMNRRYRTEQYSHIIKSLRTRQPNAAIGADVMVGFPGETDAEFDETVRFIDSLPITYLHVFSYSEREGTPATKLGGHHSRAIKDRRNRELRKLGLEKREEFHRRHIGDVVSVLVEDSRDPITGSLRGLTDNYIRVTTDASRTAINTFVPIRIVDADAHGAAGIAICDSADESTAGERKTAVAEVSV